MSQPPRPWLRVPPWVGSRLAWAIAAGVAVVVALSVWVSALSAPVERVGKPTGSVSRPPAVATSATPTASESTSATSTTATSSPTSSATSRGMAASGKFDTSTISVPAVGSEGTQRRYVVAVETSSDLSANAVARKVAATLNDPRSWTGGGQVRFSLVADPKRADFTVYLSAPATAASQCGKDTDWTCASGTRLVINAVGWQTPPATYAGATADFQRYLVNHAAGLFLGESLATCSKSGGPAPVMADQGRDLKGCTANPWPHS